MHFYLNYRRFSIFCLATAGNPPQSPLFFMKIKNRRGNVSILIYVRLSEICLALQRLDLKSGIIDFKAKYRTGPNYQFRLAQKV